MSAALSPRLPTEGEAAVLAALATSSVSGSARARNFLVEHGLPTRRHEAWRWSDLRERLTPDVHIPAPDAQKDTSARDNTVFAPLGNVIAELAIGFGRDRVVTVPAGATQEVVENLGTSGGLDTRFTQILVGEGATLFRLVVQTQDGISLSSANVRVARGGRYRQFIVAEGGKLARVETSVSIEGEGAQVELNGVYLVDQGRHADLTSVIQHKAPDCQTRQLVKGVARRGGRGVFQGKITVERDAQRSDARQYHHGLLLEDGAEIFAKPELLIFADDVQCAHGNTAGGLDAQALFYMRTRGLAESEARAILIEAFLAEAVPETVAGGYRDTILSGFGKWLREPRP